MKKIVVTGGTGFIGEKLCLELFRKGYEVVVLSRSAKRAAEKLPLPFTFVEWNSRDPLPPSIVSGAEAVVHLAGESVAAHRWNKKIKEEILQSRVVSTRRLAEAIQAAPVKPRAFIGASGIGFYGDRGDEILTESTKGGNDFLAEVCRQWEAAYEPAGVRTVILRTGMVLGHNGGALEKMLPAFRLGIAGKIGSGRQLVSWIHLEDLVRMYIHAIETPSTNGLWNATSPEPITNAGFTRELGRALRRPAFLAAPMPLLRLALGEMAGALFASQRALPTAPQSQGFVFRFASLSSALAVLLRPLGVKGAYVFEAALWIPAPRSRVFAFFSAAKNLEEITPPWLKFRIRNVSTPAIQEGTLIDYSLLIKGVPVKWRTLIEKWNPENEFVDRQLRGPYQTWHHTHSFEDARNGTLMRDRVVYRPPLGLLGDLAHLLMIRRDVRTIFGFRKKHISGMKF